MHCKHCGAPLSDNAKYCAQCGSKVGGAEEQSAPVSCKANEAIRLEQPTKAAPSKSKRPFIDSLVEFRQTTLKAVPNFVLALLLFLATAGAAYAAYRVVTDIVLPAIEEHASSNQDKPSNTDGDRKDGENTSSMASDATYQFDTVTKTVMVRNDPLFREEGQPAQGEAEWTYIQFKTDKGVSPQLKKLNKKLKDQFEKEASDTETDALDEEALSEDRTSRQDACSAIIGKYAFTYTERYITNWGPHGWLEYESHVYDLASGKEVPVWTALNIEKQDLLDKTRDALTAYAQKQNDLHQDAITYMTKDDIKEEVDTYLDDSDGRPACYIMTEDGLYIATDDYSFGRSYAEGSENVLVIPNDGSIKGQFFTPEDEAVG